MCVCLCYDFFLGGARRAIGMGRETRDDRGEFLFRPLLDDISQAFSWKPRKLRRLPCDCVVSDPEREDNNNARHSQSSLLLHSKQQQQQLIAHLDLTWARGPPHAFSGGVAMARKTCETRALCLAWLATSIHRRAWR